ncbi:hypothetical protein E2C01_023249 [Portunus trituberculatus]|uniref:Uncharacterized protein n=1 Tax=Portunus trituberculatus TaxID=210409 RepID=A0A5B7E9I5_PORTR|nr:hypothetical protein [Portunus trituberculatus]
MTELVHSSPILRKELGAQEERYQKQIDELTLSLAEKQDEVSKLGQTLETLKGVQETLANTEELQEKLSLLQQDVRDRNAQLDCKYQMVCFIILSILHIFLFHIYAEHEISKVKITPFFHLFRSYYSPFSFIFSIGISLKEHNHTLFLYALLAKCKNKDTHRAHQQLTKHPVLW